MYLRIRISNTGSLGVLRALQTFSWLGGRLGVLDLDLRGLRVGSSSVTHATAHLMKDPDFVTLRGGGIAYSSSCVLSHVVGVQHKIEI